MEQVESEKEKKAEQEEKEDTTDIDQIIDNLQGSKEFKYLNSLLGSFNYHRRLPRSQFYINDIL